MVQAATGPESPVETAFNDLFEVIPELAELEMYSSTAQIVPGREASPDTLLAKVHSLEDAKLYGSETNLTMIKDEPSDTFTPCHFPSSTINGNASRYLPFWLTRSMMLDQERCDPELQSWMYGSGIVKQEPTDPGDQLLIQQTQHLVQASAPEARDYFCDHRNPTLAHVINSNPAVPEAEPRWFGSIGLGSSEDPFVSMDNTTELSEMSSDPCLSEYSSDLDQPDIKPKIERMEEDNETSTATNEKIWFGSSSFTTLPSKREKVDARKTGRKQKATFKTGRPRLCAFLIELLSTPEKYSHLIEWVDEDKGIFKFMNSTKVAREWGERRNKPMMKYENFARSLRTYIAKGILSKPRSKLVYRFKN